MEEELEKQAAAFEQERKILKAGLAKEELRYQIAISQEYYLKIFKIPQKCFRVKELEQELIALRAENEALKKHQQQLQQNAALVASGSSAAKSRAAFSGKFRV